MVNEFTGTAAADGRIVAVGWAEDSAGIWTSADGRKWERAVFHGASSLTLLAAVVAGGPGFVAVGWEYPTGFVAISADGQTWERVDDAMFADQDLNRIGAVDGRLVVFSGGDGAGVFTSSDGRVWQQSDDTTAQDVADGLVALTGDGSTLWAFSRDGNEPRQNRQLIEVWRSNDGMTWTQVGQIEGSGGTQLARAASGESGVVLVANVNQRGTYPWLTWYSADGVTWQAAGNSPTNIDDVLAGQAGFVAVGHYNTGQGCALIETDDVGVTWTSVDGLTWRQMPEQGWNGREVQVMARNGRTLIGLGMDWNRFYNDESGGAVWTTALPGAAVDDAPPPGPTVEPTPGPGCG